MDNKSLSNTRWKCQYHIIFIPKYRKKVLYGQLKNDIRDILCFRFHGLFEREKNADDL